MEIGIDTLTMEHELENIISQEFKLERKGFNKTEVKEYLVKLAWILEENSSKITELENEVADLKTIVIDYQKIEKELKNSLVFLNESERDTLIKTKDQVSTMIKEAEISSAEIINNAENEAKSTRDTLLFLKEQKEIFITRLRIIIESQEGMLNDFRNGINSAELNKTMAEGAAFKTQTEMNIDTILEKLL